MKMGGMAGLTRKIGRESGIREAYWGPSMLAEQTDPGQIDESGLA